MMAMKFRRINQGHDLIQELAEHHEMHHRALDGEAKRQKAVLQLKLQQKEKRENHSMDNNHHDQNLKHEHAEKKDQEQHQTLSAREQQGPEKEIGELFLFTYLSIFVYLFIFPNNSRNVLMVSILVRLGRQA